MSYSIVEREDGSAHLQNGIRQIMTKKEMLDLIPKLMKFIANDVTDEDIKKFNEEMYEENMISCYGPNWKQNHPDYRKTKQKKTQ